jgi:hypothetical protein
VDPEWPTEFFHGEIQSAFALPPEKVALPSKFARPPRRTTTVAIANGRDGWRGREQSHPLIDSDGQHEVGPL